MNLTLKPANNKLSSLLLAAALLFIASCSNAPKNLEKTLTGLGIGASNIEGFVIKESDGGLHLAEKRSSEAIEIIRIKATENIEKDAAQKSINEQIKLMTGVFEAQLPPYPEYLTKEIGCAERFRPKRKETAIGFYNLMYAGKRLTYGVCVDDLAFYAAGQGFFYAPGRKRLLKIEYFVPKDMGQEKIEGFFNSLKLLP